VWSVAATTENVARRTFVGDEWTEEKRISTYRTRRILFILIFNFSRGHTRCGALPRRREMGSENAKDGRKENLRCLSVHFYFCACRAVEMNLNIDR
jgi:hypothetical protein